MSQFEENGLGQAKQALFDLLYAATEKRKFVECSRDGGLSNKNVQDLKRRNVPSMSFEAAVRHARLFGHDIKITVDGVELPKGD